MFRLLNCTKENSERALSADRSTQIPKFVGLDELSRSFCGVTSMLYSGAIYTFVYRPYAMIGVDW